MEYEIFINERGKVVLRIFERFGSIHSEIGSTIELNPWEVNDLINELTGILKKV